MSEHAGRWLRVSSGGQDEANQAPAIDAWIAGHGYDVPDGCTYLVHGKSASKGKHQKYLDQVIADMRAGKITVLIVWQTSRIERRGAENLFDLLRRVREAGGRIEFTEDSHLNDMVSEMSDVNLAMHASVDKMKSRNLSKTTTAGHDRARSNGATIGRPPWGYTTEGEKYERRNVPTPEGRKYWPEVLTRIADGQQLGDVAEWLTSVTDRAWHPRVLAQAVRCTSYRGQVRDASGTIVHECEALVSADLWNRANANLDGRPSNRRGQRNDLATGASVLSGLVVCGNPECDASGSNGDSPMYKTGTVYRCTGKGAGKRRGCGCSVLATEADALMDAAMAGMTRPVLRPVFHPAEGHGIEIAGVTQKLRDLPALGLDEDTEDAKRAELRGRRRELEAMPNKAAWTEFVPVLDEAGQPVTYASRWASYGQAERRTQLREAGFALTLARPHMVTGADEHDDHPDELLSRTDVWQSETAALIFTWTGDEDEGLARGLA